MKQPRYPEPRRAPPRTVRSMVLLSCEVAPSVRLSLRQIAIERQVHMKALVTGILTDWLRAQGVRLP